MVYLSKEKKRRSRFSDETLRWTYVEFLNFGKDENTSDGAGGPGPSVPPCLMMLLLLTSNRFYEKKNAKEHGNILDI